MSRFPTQNKFLLTRQNLYCTWILEDIVVVNLALDMMLIVALVLLFTTHIKSTWTSSRFLSSRLRSRLFSSIISVPHDNNSESFTRNAFNLTGICCGDDWQCTMPQREFGVSSGISYNGPSSHQLLLKWNTGPNRILFLCKPDPEAYDGMLEALHFLEAKGIKVFVEDAAYAFIKQSNANFKHIFSLNNTSIEQLDLVIAFGGDGLLMHANTLFGTAVPPIMCFDFGSLGFLAPFNFEDFTEEMEAILGGSALLTLRMRLQCSIIRNGTELGSYRVLNEVVVDRGPSPYLSTIDLSCDQQYLTTVQADGIIIATPTGSTAYSLAAGGSMVHPSVPAILLTPICAHTLSFRPLLLPDSCILSAEVPEDCRANAWVSFDGKFRQELTKGDRLEVKMSSFPMPTINKLNFTADWFQALRSAFMFNVRPRQKPLGAKRTEI